MITLNCHGVAPTARINHYPDLRSLTITAKDEDGSTVALFFRATDGTSELAVAEAWLRDALAKVEVAKIDAANDQPAPLLPERVSNEVCGAELAYGIPGVDEVVWTCTQPAGHEDWHRPTWPSDAARIGEPLDLTAGAL